MSTFYIRWWFVKYCTGVLRLNRMVWKTQLLTLKALRNASGTDQHKQEHKYEKSVDHRDMERQEEKVVTKIKPQIHKSPLKLDSRDKQL